MEPDLLSWKPAARESDPETSKEAAKDAKLGASAGRLLVLKHLMAGSKTDFELADATGWQQTSIGKRRGECVTFHLVKPMPGLDGRPMKRRTPSGSMARVWGITLAGRDFYFQNTSEEER